LSTTKMIAGLYGSCLMPRSSSRFAR